MPCNTRVRIQLDITNMDADTLKAALQAMGHESQQRGDLVYGLWGSINLQTGQYTSSAYSQAIDTNTIKRAYTAQVQRKTMARFGWKPTKQINAWTIEYKK